MPSGTTSRAMRQWRWRFLLVIGFLTAGAVFPASGQVAVYHVEFETEPASINFAFFQSGFLVMDGLQGTGSFILTYEDSGQTFYTLAENSAQWFVAKEGEQRKAVLRATAQTSSSLSHYLAIGDLDELVSYSRLGQDIAFEVASQLEGHVLASDDEAGAAFDPNADSRGFAGMSSMALTYDKAATNSANFSNLDVALTVADLVADLEAAGATLASGQGASTSDPASTDPGAGAASGNATGTGNASSGATTTTSPSS